MPFYYLDSSFQNGGGGGTTYSSVGIQCAAGKTVRIVQVRVGGENSDNFSPGGSLPMQFEWGGTALGNGTTIIPSPLQADGAPAASSCVQGGHTINHTGFLTPFGGSGDDGFYDLEEYELVLRNGGAFVFSVPNLTIFMSMGILFEEF